MYVRQRNYCCCRVVSDPAQAAAGSHRLLRAPIPASDEEVCRRNELGTQPIADGVHHSAEMIEVPPSSPIGSIRESRSPRTLF